MRLSSGEQRRTTKTQYALYVSPMGPFVTAKFLNGTYRLFRTNVLRNQIEDRYANRFTSEDAPSIVASREASNLNRRRLLRSSTTHSLSDCFGSLMLGRVGSLMLGSFCDPASVVSHAVRCKERL